MEDTQMQRKRTGSIERGGNVHTRHQCKKENYARRAPRSRRGRWLRSYTGQEFQEAKIDQDSGGMEKKETLLQQPTHFKIYLISRLQLSSKGGGWGGNADVQYWGTRKI